MQCKKSLSWIVWSLLVFAGISSGVRTSRASVSAESYRARDHYDLRVSRGEARDVLLGILDELSFKSDADLEARLPILLRSYRGTTYQDKKGWLAPGRDTIAGAPFLGFVVYEKLAELYPALYDQAYAEQYEKLVEHPTLESIFDQFLSSYVNGDLPPDLQKGASALGFCLAKRAMRGKADFCKLDDSDLVRKPNPLALAAAKMSCPLPMPAACTTRHLIYDYAKEDLIKARNSRALEGPLKASFPKAFREEFLKGISEKRAGFSELVNAKFKGTLNEFWNERTPLVEADDFSTGTVTLHGFAAGLRADLGVASRLANSTDPKERGLAAPLFFAVANRILLLTGGTQSVFENGSFKLDPKDRFNPDMPKAVPLLLSQPFGGWGSGSIEGGKMEFSPWNWSTYDPARTESPSPYRLFAVPLAVGGRSDQTSESLSDLADLLSSLTDFIKSTREEGPFGRFFGGANDFDKILQPESPILFPKEGRLLAIGAMAGVLKNLVAPKVGHIEMTNVGTPEAGLGITFHDRVTLTGREQTGASVQGVAKILMAAADLRNALHDDKEIPAELTAMVPQLDSAVQLGALTLSAQAQGEDGGFAEYLTLPATSPVAPSSRLLMSSVAGMRALTRAYDASQILVLRLSIKSSWQFLDRFWGDRVIPRLAEGASQSVAVHASDLWSVLRLWNESQRVARPDLAADVDWVKWEGRMTAIRRLLIDQLRSAHGPEPVLE